jgi:hypothetical protein
MGFRLALLVSFTLACSSPPFASDDIAIPTDASFDQTLSDGFPTNDVVGTDAPLFNGGGPFECNGCICDGTLHFCEFSSGGKAPIVDASSDAADDASDAEATCNSDPDAGPVSSCVAIPIDCLPKPTCACVLEHASPICTCDIDSTGNGIVVSCIYP